MTLARRLASRAVRPALFAQATMLADGWRRAAIAFAAGAVTVLALAPFNFWPAAFLTFPFLVWLIDGSAGHYGGVPTAAAIGWWFGFGYFFAGLYWVGYAFLVDAATFGWLLPIAVIVLPAGLAPFTALGCAIARLLWTRGPMRVLALAIGLTISEWLRGFLFTGFPWNAFGYTLTGPLVLAQSAAVFGLWGLTFLAVAIFASPAALADDRYDAKRPWLPLLISVLCITGLAAFGAMRLASTPTRFVDGVKLRIMQPNLPQDVKFRYSAKQQVLDRYIALSERDTGPNAAGLTDVTHLIWPESAFPFFLTREPDALAQIAAMLPANTLLITGAVRAPAEIGNSRIIRAYNSMYVIDGAGNILAVYDKMHLVPFGEYLPLQSLLERLGLMQLTEVQGGFVPGHRRRRIELPGTPPMLPLICYEAIFPDEAVPAGERPGWIVNVTNDGWFGLSSGPYQHLQQARMLAIEQGVPLVRAANTGISAVIDPVGRIVRSLPLGSEGIIDSRLPSSLSSTAFIRTGNGLIGLLLGASLILVARQKLYNRE